VYHEGSLLLSKYPVTGPYPEPAKSSPHPQTLFLVVRPILKLPSAPAKEILPFRFETSLHIPRILPLQTFSHIWYQCNCARHFEVPYDVIFSSSCCFPPLVQMCFSGSCYRTHSNLPFLRDKRPSAATG